MALLPQKWGRSMRASSEGWRICCRTCGASRTVWQAGGIRWGAASTSKRKLVYCSQCGRLRVAFVEWQPHAAESGD